MDLTPRLRALDSSSPVLGLLHAQGIDRIDRGSAVRRQVARREGAQQQKKADSGECGYVPCRDFKEHAAQEHGRTNCERYPKADARNAEPASFSQDQMVDRTSWRAQCQADAELPAARKDTEYITTP